jgi:pyruvate/2-oxoacid:ferredoxin oxidoreductase beta subunit
MVEIMVAHKIPYTATATVAYPEDLIKKVNKAKEIKGPKYLHVFAPCPTGWRMAPGKSVEISRLAVQTYAFPLYEVENGVYTVSKKPKQRPITEYLKLQDRFKHMPDELVDKFQENVNREWEVLLKKEEFTKTL